MGGELNCDLTNRLRNTCKLCLWLINLQMLYAIEIIRGNLFLSLSLSLSLYHMCSLAPFGDELNTQSTVAYM